MKLFRAIVCLLAGLGVALGASQGLEAYAQDRIWPVSGPVVRGFDPPEQTYGAGHRGIDIAAPPGTEVVAPADGVISFVGVINYVAMLTITHGDVRTTYQPVSSTLAQGDKVVLGQVIGFLLDGHGSTTSLHFGVLQGSTYLDPLAWLGGSPNPIRLLPAGSTVPPLPPGTNQANGTANGWPVAGRVSSGFGWRMHPIRHVRQFHDGIDIAAPCGTPVVTPWAGVVASTGTSSSMGRYIIISHASGLVTTYMHLSAILVSAGQQLAGNQQIGWVGTTGLSTGCHLHFRTHRNGVAVNPLTLLP